MHEDIKELVGSMIQIVVEASLSDRSKMGSSGAKDNVAKD